MNFGFQPTVDLTPFLEKLEKNKLTLEDILEENSIIDDIKNNYKSQFIDFLTNEKIKKLIDYSTKLPSSDSHNIGFKYPFNATEILCSENTNFQKKFMTEKPFISKDKLLKEKLNQAKKINKKGFISELFKIINKVKNEEKSCINKIEENKNNDKDKDKDNNMDSNEEDNEDSFDEENIDLDKDQNKENKNNKVIYENVDYLLHFLKESDETKENYVLVGYFYKILNTLINLHSIKIIEYLFDYPKKDEFDVLGLFIKHMNRKSMCNIIYKLLIFEDEFISKFDEKKINLLEKILNELNICNNENKNECICDLLSLVMNNNQFFNLFMNQQQFLGKIYEILFNSEKNAKKTISILKLLNKINENTLQQFEVLYTSITQENNNEINPFNVETCYSHEQDKSISSHEDNSEILKKFLLLLFNILEKNKFDFLKDFGNFNTEENLDFTATYMGKQKKLGMTKIAQIEYLLSIIEIFINAYASKYHENKIENLIYLANEKNLFFNAHDIFLLFPFSNIYQILYKKLMEFALNENTPSCLVNTIFIESKGLKRNLIELYIDKIISDMEFNFDLTKTKCFNPCFSYIISILNKIYKSKNIHVKKIIENNKNISVFNEIMGEEINNIFNQKLLLNDTFDNFANNEEEKPLQTFGPKNLLEIFEENCKIYENYKNGGNYKELLNEKKERKEKEEKEKNENNIPKKIKKISSLDYIDDLEDEDDDPLFKVEKINLEKEKENFLTILNRPTEEIIQDQNINNNKDNNSDNDKNVDNVTNVIYKQRYNINDLEDNEDEDEKEKDIIEDDDKLNDDLAPNQMENKIYHVDYIKKFENDEN